MSSAESFHRRIHSLIEAAGGKKPLARCLGVTDSAINSWLAGSRPFEKKLRAACDHAGLSYSWLRDGQGRAENELAKVMPNGTGQRRVFYDDSPPPAMRVAQGLYSEDGWQIVVRVLADRLTSTQIAEAMNEILAHKVIDEGIRNAASQILIAAQLPKLKR